MAINEAKLNEFMGKVVCDVGAAMSAVLVVIGDRLFERVPRLLEQRVQPVAQVVRDRMAELASQHSMQRQVGRGE